MGKGSNTSTTSTANAADPQAAAAYRDILQRAQGVASTPYQAYSGPLTADINSQQNLGIGGINANANFASPYIQQAAGLAGASSAPVGASQIQQYLNPYTQNVVDATTQQLMHDNQQQQAQLTGNQISQGALGGNATGVARGILGGQQARTLASTTAGLYSQGYQQALDAAQRQQQTGLAGANAMANYGISGQGAALQGAGQQINAGSLQQQTEQQRLNALYQQYAQAQAFPYQQTQWLAGIGTGVGSNLGGTSSGQTTGPAPNQTAQWLGTGLAAAGLFLNRGGAVRGYGEGGGIISDEDPTGVAPGQQFAQSSPWQMRPSGGGQVQVINVRTGQVVYTGTASGAANAQASWGARSWATGGGVAGYAEGGAPGPWGGLAPSWIPTMNIHGGSGAPQAHAPTLPGQQQSSFDPAKFATGVVGLNNKNLSGRIGQFFNPEAYGSGNGVYGGSSGSPLAGLDASDYGVGFAQGGGVVGYASGGGPSVRFVDDPLEAQGMFGEGEPQLSPGASFEERSAPVREAVASGDFDPRGINSTEFRGSPSMEASNRGVVPFPAPRPNGAGAPVMASGEEGDDAPTGVAGRAQGPRQGGVAAFAPEGAGSYVALPDAITRPKESFGLGLVSPNAKTGLLAAGLGMLASRSPFLGNAVGEGGLAGVGAYSGAEAADRKVATEAAKLSREARKQFVDEAMGVRKQNEVERSNRASEAKEFKPTWGKVDEDPITGRAIMGWIDPNKKTTEVPGATAKADAPVKAEGIPGHLAGKDYMEELERRNPEFARTVKAVGDYRASITSLSQRGGLREKILEAANRYNPEYDQAHYGEKTRALSAFAAGPEGRAVRSLNVSIDHLDTLREAGEALKNGNYPALNKIVNYVREKTGSPITTNFDSIKQVVSSEIAKAVVGGQTAIHDRDDMAKRAANSQSPDQINGIIEQFQKLMAGQMKGLSRAYTATTRLKNFDDYLEPRTRRVLSGLSHVDEGGAGGFKPPEGALPGKPDANGKVWYYDPATKQPYPGQ